MPIEDELREIADREQDAIRHERFECAILVVPGEVLRLPGRWSDRFELPDEWEEIARDNDRLSILIHNHPLRGPPSAEDFEVAHQLGLLEMRVVGLDFSWMCCEASGFQWW